MVGWAPSIVIGASVALARRFSASGWLPDVRRYRATYFNYTGKPLVVSGRDAGAARRRRQHGAGRVRQRGVAGGGRAVRRRFGVEVIDAFGATEGGIAVNRDDGDARRLRRQGRRHASRWSTRPAASCRGASSATTARLLNADECVGEIVNTAGAGPFEGYYNNDEATSSTLRNGWYWSGDLGYVDDDGFLYFAGRTAEWIRVDGENFPAGPIEDAHRPSSRCRARRGVRRAGRARGRPGDGGGAVARRRCVRPVRVRVVRRLAGRRRTEVASSLRARGARVPVDRHQQDRQAHTGAPEVPP